MKAATFFSLLALASLAFASCTTPGSNRGVNPSGSYSSGASGGGGFFSRAPEESWQDRTFRSGGY